MQWNQNTSAPSVNVLYPQSQNMISPNSYPSATYSFTADFRTPTQSDPLITATSTFKPLQLQNPQKTPSNYTLFQKQVNYNSQKSHGAPPKRSQPILYVQDGQKLDQNAGNSYTILNHQAQSHQDYGYSCVNSSGKVQVKLLSVFTLNCFLGYLFL